VLRFGPPVLEPIAKQTGLKPEVSDNVLPSRLIQLAGGEKRPAAPELRRGNKNHQFRSAGLTATS
jgi:hypothetical protein